MARPPRLRRHGRRPHPTFRDGGQNIDVRGEGRDVLRRMGLDQAALDLGTGEQGTAWVDANGHIMAHIMTEPGTDGPTAEMEILRGDLARLLYEPARTHRNDDQPAQDGDDDGAKLRVGPYRLCV